MRILQVISIFGFGGAERVLVDLVKGLENQHEFELCVLQGQHAYPERFRDVVKPLALGHSGSFFDLGSTRRAVGRLRQKIADFQPDILHTHLWPADLVGAWAIRGLSVRHVSHQHGTSPWLAAPGIKNSVKRAVTRRLLLDSGARFVAVSRAVADYMEHALGLPSSRFCVVHNGVDCDYFQPALPSASRSDGPFVIGAAARLAPEKGIDRLIRALASLRDKGLDAELLIAGEGGQRTGLAQLAIELGIGPQVRFMGNLEDMRPFYRQLDVFVLPSISSEGLPLALLEAMAMALPVVATRVGGAEEVLHDGQQGCLVPPDCEEALTAAIAGFAREPERRHALGIAGRNRVESHFTVARFSRRMAEYYASLCEPAPQGPLAQTK